MKPSLLYEYIMAGCSLDRFSVIETYFIELQHGLFGTFPALVGAQQLPFFCRDVDTVEAVLKRLPPQEPKVTRHLVIFHGIQEKAFSIQVLAETWSRNEKPSEIRVISMEDLRNPSSKLDFNWAPGLIGGNMTRAAYNKACKEACGGLRKNIWKPMAA